ncbi:hypothetical protein PAMC26577_37605 [Caballeronia sordidicola]|uniref:Uncharacterized protein n=1 Tax=Caballeronia sordidicola TaxID=196367 RepID=A0A242M5Y5_CABSO|nr:hypothetical protein PAMC26577_37605 [Caballeronia sordidicola]
MHARMVNLKAALSHHLFEIANAQDVNHVSPDTQQDHSNG